MVYDSQFPHAKGAAVLGALRTGIINVLVTDLACVREIIRLEKQEADEKK